MGSQTFDHIYPVSVFHLVFEHVFHENQAIFLLGVDHHPMPKGFQSHGDGFLGKAGLEFDSRERKVIDPRVMGMGVCDEVQKKKFIARGKGPHLRIGPKRFLDNTV